jgi:Arc/MetJ family transcription regulator
VQEEVAVATNFDLDEALIEEAVRLGGHRTKRATMNEALQESIAKRQQLGILDLLGTIDYYPEYEPKKYRSR